MAALFTLGQLGLRCMCLDEGLRCMCLDEGLRLGGNILSPIELYLTTTTRDSGGGDLVMDYVRAFMVYLSRCPTPRARPLPSRGAPESALS